MFVGEQTFPKSIADYIINRLLGTMCDCHWLLWHANLAYEYQLDCCWVAMEYRWLPRKWTKGPSKATRVRI